MVFIRGTQADDELLGTAGADRIFGLGGFDTIRAGAGADVAYGGDDGDSIRGGLGGDGLFGGGGEDELEGDQGNDRLFGGAGDDFIQDSTDFFAGGGDQRLPDGNDRYDGGAGDDAVAYTDQAVGIRVTLADGGALSRVFQGSEVDTLRNIESVGGTAADDRIIGNNLANSFSFAEGHDHFEGRGGADSFRGAFFSELDTLFADGGAGNDSFETGEGIERIFAGTGADEIVASFEEDPEPGRVDTIDLGRDAQADVYRTSMGEGPFIGGFIGMASTG